MNFLRSGWFRLVLVLAFFLCTSYFDYVVHGMLYSYGLRFDFAWAYPYWISYGLFYVIFILALRSWLAFLLWAGFFQDILTVAVWQRQHDWLTTWWWHPFTLWFGAEWNLLCQTVFLFSVLAVGLSFRWWWVHKHYSLEKLYDYHLREFV